MNLIIFYEGFVKIVFGFVNGVGFCLEEELVIFENYFNLLFIFKKWMICMWMYIKFVVKGNIFV